MEGVHRCRVHTILVPCPPLGSTVGVKHISFLSVVFPSPAILAVLLRAQSALPVGTAQEASVHSGHVPPS